MMTLGGLSTLNFCCALYCFLRTFAVHPKPLSDTRSPEQQYRRFSVQQILCFSVGYLVSLTISPLLYESTQYPTVQRILEPMSHVVPHIAVYLAFSIPCVGLLVGVSVSFRRMLFGRAERIRIFAVSQINTSRLSFPDACYREQRWILLERHLAENTWQQGCAAYPTLQRLKVHWLPSAYWNRFCQPQGLVVANTGLCRSLVDLWKLTAQTRNGAAARLSKQRM